jgi:dolichyl-phosphate-mannose--protein O-mannosyl transferase
MSYDLELAPLDLDLEELERAVKPTFAERMASRRQAAVDGIRRNRVDLLILVALLALAGVVHAVGMDRSPARFDDEGTYTAYAWAVQYTGKLGHYTYWYAHPPLGWVQLAAWNWVTNAFAHAPYAVAAERQFMLLAKLVSVALLYGLALRLRMNRLFAVATVLLFALSPLAVYFTRTALLDNIVTPWLLAAFFLAASPRRSMGAAAGSAA